MSSDSEKKAAQLKAQLEDLKNEKSLRNTAFVLYTSLLKIKEGSMSPNNKLTSMINKIEGEIKGHDTLISIYEKKIAKTKEQLHQDGGVAKPTKPKSTKPKKLVKPKPTKHTKLVKPKSTKPKKPTIVRKHK